MIKESFVCLFRNFVLAFNFVSTDVKVEKETLTYTGISLVSELGGALGLFIGFSLLGLWDYFESLTRKIGSNFNRE